VTSSKQDKIDRAKELGAKGGVNYREDDWSKKLAAMLPKDRPTLDAVIDSAGGNVTTQLLKVLKHGARVAVYGQ
jgi:NADPH:quinone reductase-like Zn-dependent oxidoreductase